MPDSESLFVSLVRAPLLVWPGSSVEVAVAVPPWVLQEMVCIQAGQWLPGVARRYSYITNHVLVTSDSNAKVPGPCMLRGDRYIQWVGDPRLFAVVAQPDTPLQLELEEVP